MNKRRPNWAREIEDTTGLIPFADKVIVQNAGGTATTDWVDSNSDGLGDEWNKLGTPTTTIVTGNGFYGNAQRIDCTVSAQNINSTVLDIGKTYKVSIKYRCSVVNALRIYNAGVLSLGTPAANTGNAASYETALFTAVSTNLAFYSFVAGGWFEIDEVNIVEYPLIANYKFDGNANDSSGNGDDGTVNGATLTTYRFGQPNKAYSFTTNDYITSPINNSIKNISFWCYPTANNKDIIQLASGIYISINSSNEIAGTGLTNLIYTVNGKYNVSLELNKWNFVSISFDSVTANAVIFGYSTTYYEGKLDDIKIYSRALTTKEIKDLYFEGIN